MARLFPAAIAALALGAAAPAHAATVEVVAGGFYDEAVSTAGAGEKKDVLVSRRDPNVLRISDLGATITAGSGCELIDEHTAECKSSRANFYFARVRAGDGDDTVRASSGTVASVAGIRANGGPGNDTLV